jgi:hypothetical protein
MQLGPCQDQPKVATPQAAVDHLHSVDPHLRAAVRMAGGTTGFRRHRPRPSARQRLASVRASSRPCAKPLVSGFPVGRANASEPELTPNLAILAKPRPGADPSFAGSRRGRDMHPLPTRASPSNRSCSGPRGGRQMQDGFSRGTTLPCFRRARTGARFALSRSAAPPAGGAAMCVPT